MYQGLKLAILARDVRANSMYLSSYAICADKTIGSAAIKAGAKVSDRRLL